MAFTVQGKRRTAMAEINVTPLVDVMLVLLIIFMVTAPMMQEGVSVQLPQAGGKPIPTSQVADDIVVAVAQDGSIYVNDKPVTEDQLTHVVLEAKKKSPSTEVFLRGDTNVTYGRVLLIHSSLIKAGVETVLMITTPREGEGTTAPQPSVPHTPTPPQRGPRAAPGQ